MTSSSNSARHVPMKAEHVNAFISATKDTLETMCGTTFKRSGAIQKIDGEIVETDELLAICGFSGTVKGAVMISAPLEVGCKLVSKFLMEEVTEINYDLMDGFGEIVNILAGAADGKIKDLNLNLALPSVCYGKAAKFFAKAGNPFVKIPMIIPDIGPFSIGISMENVKK